MRMACTRPSLMDTVVPASLVPQVERLLQVMFCGTAFLDACCVQGCIEVEGLLHVMCCVSAFPCFERLALDPTSWAPWFLPVWCQKWSDCFRCCISSVLVVHFQSCIYRCALFSLLKPAFALKAANLHCAQHDGHHGPYQLGARSGAPAAGDGLYNQACFALQNACSLICMCWLMESCCDLQISRLTYLRWLMHHLGR